MISFFTAIAALAASYIAYLAFRSSTDPEVIVYGEICQDSSGLILLVIKNIGHGPARNIAFSSSSPIPLDAYGIGRADREAKYDKDSPLKSGLPYLAPQQAVKLSWGQYGGLLDATKGKHIEVTTTFSRGRKALPFEKVRLSTTSTLFIEEYKSTKLSRNSAIELADHVKKIAGSVESIAKRINR